ncbi:MAG: hypothetical protein Q9164_002298, partial [Protoblastenia rupestris]
YGTFLYNNEKERVDAHVSEKTRSVWDYFLARKEQFMNERYDGTIDDHVRGQERLILPASGGLKWWNELFGRTDAEMNGPVRNPRPLAGINGAADTPVLTGVETANNAVGAGAPSSALPNGDASALSRLAASLSGLSASSDGSVDDGITTREAKRAMEVEMQ